MNEHKKYTKRELIQPIAQNLGDSINVAHIASVLSIFIDEMTKELLSGNEIKIANFGTFLLKNIKGTVFRNVVSKKLATSKKTRALRFKLTRRFRKWLSNKYYQEMKNSIQTNKDCP